MARPKKDPAPGETVRVVVRFSLWVDRPATGLVPAGDRLLKGDADAMPCPREIHFVTDDPEDAEKSRATLEKYLNAWENRKA